MDGFRQPLLHDSNSVIFLDATLRRHELSTAFCLQGMERHALATMPTNLFDADSHPTR